MNKEEAIKYLQQLYPNGGHCWLDEQRIEAIGMAVKALQEEPISVWHNVQYPYDETKTVLIVAIDHTLHLWKGKFDTDKMCNAFRLFTGTDWNNKPLSIVSKWAYIDDLLKF